MVDQFTQDTCNDRTDQWGGSVENRARFGLEVAKAVSAAIGPSRTGIRLSPYSEFQAMRMADPVPQFMHLITRLSELGLAYLHMTTPRVQGAADVKGPVADMSWAVRAWGNGSPVILAGAYSPQTAVEEVDTVYPDRDVIIAFGRLFIANPDLPYRAKNSIEPNPYDRSTFYTPFSTAGYTDYPFSKEWETETIHPRL
jgi:NADPH2 dehydrogenase